ncbi:MAG: type II toxin-antitoxin system RelE/ParE family toxin [Nitrospira sp.]|nr:type II toxin-antitoxin system RelE/ParE family toxin [Nitrospira sp.]
MKVRWTEQALARLADIEDYIAQDNPVAAAKLIERILRRGDGLAQFPNRGRVIPELENNDIREVFEGNYRIAYRNRNQIEILTVFEGHLLLPISEIENAD